MASELLKDAENDLWIGLHNLEARNYFKFVAFHSKIYDSYNLLDVVMVIAAMWSCYYYYYQ